MSSNEHPLVIKYKNFSPKSENLAAKAREVFQEAIQEQAHTIVHILYQFPKPLVAF